MSILTHFLQEFYAKTWLCGYNNYREKIRDKVLFLSVKKIGEI